MYVSSAETFNLSSAMHRHWRVLFALMLRNMRTKFLGHGLGSLIAIGWPLTHIIVIVLIFSVAGRAPPFGDSTALFVATGVLPFQTFAYLARFMMMSVVRNRPLLAFPEVKVLDLLLSSALLEILAACCVAVVFIVLAWGAGINPMPRDVLEAAYAFGAAILLGLGFGLLNGVIVLAMPGWMVVFALLNILFWASAGVVFVPDALPEIVRYPLSFHPVLQAIEWMRSAYYEGYGDLILDRKYVLEVGVIMVFLGLLAERAVRGHLLSLK